MEFDANTNPDPFVSADELPIVEEELEEILSDVDKELLEKSSKRTQLARDISAKLYEADSGRDGDEKRWLNAYRNYRGQYDGKFRESEKSKVFVKVTKTKVLAAYGQLVDVVFNGNKFPIGIEPTHIPEGIAEFAHLKSPNEPEPSIEGKLEPELDTVDPRMEALAPFMVGHKGDGKQLRPGARLGDGNIFLGDLEDEYSDDTGNTPLVEGPAILPGPQISPAKEAAKNMEKLIHDQIEESNGSVEVRNSLFEAALLGTGIIKGPFNYEKTLHRWVKMDDGTRSYEPDTKRVPRIEFVSVWDFYPDPNARSMEEAEWVIQRHRLNSGQLRALVNRPFFDSEEIDGAIEDGPNYADKDFETTIRAEDGNHQGSTQNRFEVLEYWGNLDKEVAEDLGLITEEMEHIAGAEIQANIWVCGGRVLRAVVNPFTPTRIPYLAFPYEKNPYSFFGIGVAENMEDSQMIMNGHARMAIDNLALAGNLVLDIDESALAPGQDMELYPGKIFRRQAGMPGQAIYGLKFPNTAPENMAMFDRFRQLADESTGMPSYSHGQTGVQSTTRTASGMSMLMSAASLNIKTVIKNLDDYLLKELGEAFYNWNMAFYEGDLAVVGDLEVRARGTESLIQKEVRSQRLTTVLQTVQNPALAPFVKMPTILKELALSLDLNPDEILNDPDEAAIYAQIIGLAGGAAPMSPMGEAGAGPIAPQVPAVPGEEGFSGVPQMPAAPEGMPQ